MWQTRLSTANVQALINQKRACGDVLLLSDSRDSIGRSHAVLLTILESFRY
jgi:hypothetical protein